MEDSPIPSSSGISRPTDKKPAMPDDELVELVWRNGQLLMQSQTQKSSRKSPVKFSGNDAVLPGRPYKFLSDRPEEIGPEKNHLFIQEDEMVSWLHYPLDDSFEREFCTDMLGSIPSSNAGSFSGVRSYLNPAERRSGLDSPIGGRDNGVKTAPESSRSSSFLHFPARAMSRRGIPAVGVFDNEVRESRIDSNGTPAMGRGDNRSFLPESRGGDLPGISGSVAGDVSAIVGDVGKVHGGVSTCVRTEAGVHTCNRIEVTVTSSSGGSAGRAERNVKPAVEDRKRKARETDESECQSGDIEFESTDPKKITPQSTSARRTRAAEVHNLSERRRRDRINEKMKALQELIPRCNKSDKASMLDEAIEYLKSLQLQVQMMSMGCSMPLMMFPGVQHYMPPMSMGMGMGLGIGMEMPGGLRQPVLQFPQVLHNSNVPASAPPHFGPQIPLSAFHPPSISQTDQSQVHAMNQLDPALNLVSLQNMNPMQTPNFAEPYQRYLGLHQMHVPPQNQVSAQPSTSKGVETPPVHKSG